MEYTIFEKLISKEEATIMTSLQPAISALESLFETFNQHFYNGQLPTPVITISPDTTNGAYGWCTSWKAWTDSSTAEDPDGGYYEINLCAEYLSRPLEKIASTLLHEMVHLFNQANGVKDCSRGGTYHNRKFKTAAEAHGLTVTESEKYGWNETELSESTKEFLEGLHLEGFDLQRKRISKAGKGARKQSSRKYVCPCCGMIVRATKEVNIICGDCNEQLVPEE